MHVTLKPASFRGGIVTALQVSPAGVVLNSTGSAMSVLTFQNFSLRCNKSDPSISFQIPWNWDLEHGRKIAVITTSSFLRYQLIAALAGLVPPVSGEILGGGVIGWPVGGEGGLDSKLRISHAFNFLSTVYSDCLEKSRVTLDEFWGLLSDMNIYPGLIIKELSRDQKDFFFLSLSVLFSFDCYLISKTKFLMSRAAKPLRALLQRQLEGKTLLTTSTNSRFRREFCTDGLVLGPFGEILFAGGLSEAIQWADQNLEKSEISESDDEQLELGMDLRNLESSDDQADDF